MINYFNKILELFVKSDFPDSTKNEFYGWLTDVKHSEEKQKALHNLWDGMSEGGVNEVSPETHKSLIKVRKRIDREARKGVRRALRVWQTAAAVLLVALVSTLYFATGRIDIENDLVEQYVPIAGMSRFYLPDGTEVLMNSDATLIYPQQFAGETRSVYLLGEASFKVAKNEQQPFVVKANDFQVTALGTEFNVKVYPDDPVVSATLLSGSVEVKYNNLETSKILEPNEQFSYNRLTRTGVVRYPDIDDEMAWKRGELVFKSATLEEIIPVLERKYPFTFVYSVNALHTDRFTFRFKESTSLQEIMDIIIEVSGSMKYRVEDNKYYISPL